MQKICLSFFQLKLLRAEPCWFSLYQWEADEKGGTYATHANLFPDVKNTELPDTKWQHSGSCFYRTLKTSSFEETRPQINWKTAVIIPHPPPPTSFEQTRPQINWKTAEIIPPPLPPFHSGVLRMQKLKTHVLRTQSSKVLPFRPGVGPYIAMHAISTARAFFLAYFYPSSPKDNTSCKIVLYGASVKCFFWWNQNTTISLVNFCIKRETTNLIRCKWTLGRTCPWNRMAHSRWSHPQCSCCLCSAPWRHTHKRRVKRFKFPINISTEKTEEVNKAWYSV